MNIICQFPLMHRQIGNQLIVYDQGQPNWLQGQGIVDNRTGHQFFFRGQQFPGQPMQQVGDFYGSRNRESFDRFQIGMYGFHHNNNHRGHRNFPGQQRPRSRNGNIGNYADRPGNNRTDERMNRINHTNNRKEKCFICGDFLSNCNESGVHLCDGGMTGQDRNENREPVAAVEIETPSTSDEVQKSAGEGLEARLEKLLEKIKDTLKNRYESVTETLEHYFSDRIDEINNIHREVSEERVALETLKKEIEQKARELEKEEKEIRHKQLQLKKDQEKFDMQTKKEQDEIARRWQQLRDEITRMEEMHESQMGRIKLDVGGSIYTTSRLTLTKEADSMLAAMFSGRHEIIEETDGSVFIDRDGKHFRYILNYLRDGGINIDTLPRNRQVLKEIRHEAIYYQLHGLVQQIEKAL
ncbi:hypothetical protein CHS0354_032310 [Potamilus streckersoni]|uniref:BTB domain-containing protein n=1 Tax=Potamilus streckersoni TaxID=2493646 RepID=A0AAE0RPY4_9BIVA|nr:hypothetical protein CHS0354_032310 [Potamilus streckersoni]